MDQEREPCSTEPPTLLERTEWLLRLAIPMAIGGWIQYRILDSLDPQDLAPWKQFEWKQIATGQFDSLDVNQLAENLITANVVTKGFLSIITFLGSLYFADYLTTARHRSHAFFVSFGKSTRRRIRFWIIFNSFYTAMIIAGSVALLGTEAATHSVHRLQILVHAVVLFVLLFGNDGFNGFAQRLPHLRAKRQHRRMLRARRRAERRRRRDEAEREARARAEAIRTKEAELSHLRLICSEIDIEIAELEASSEPEVVIEQQVAQLRAEQTDIAAKISHIQTTGEV